MAEISFHVYVPRNSQFWVDFNHSECQDITAAAGAAAGGAAASLGGPATAEAGAVGPAVAGATQRIREQDRGQGVRVCVTIWTGIPPPIHAPGVDVDVQTLPRGDVPGGSPSIGPVGFSI